MKRYEDETDEMPTWTWHNREFVTDDVLDWAHEKIQALEAQLTWRDATTLPAKDEVVLAKCVGENGYEVVVRAEYYRQYQELAEGNGVEFDTIELCQDDDEWYLKEGWYELIQNWSEYSSLYIDMLVEKWLPIPKE